MIKVSPLKACALLALILAGVQQAGAATIPYANDFSGIGSNTAFPVENPSSEWTVSSNVYRYLVTGTANIPSIASLPITNAAGVAFTMQTQFTITSVGTLNNAAQTLGFGLFGQDSDFTGGSGTAYYLADFSYADGTSGATEGRLRILSLGDPAGFTAVDAFSENNAGSSTLAVVLGTTYTLRLQGSYTGSTLNLSLSLFDAAGTTQLGGTATATDTTPLTGTNFGYRNRHAIGGSTLDIAFDNFSIIPEPSSLAMLAAGALIVLPRTRRRNRI